MGEILLTKIKFDHSINVVSMCLGILQPEARGQKCSLIQQDRSVKDLALIVSR